MNSNELAHEIGNPLSLKKAVDITLINIAEKSSFADFFVNATAGSERQLVALANDVEDKVAELGLETKSYEGRAESGWILVDCNEVIVNLFILDVRDKYALDKLWGDCEKEIVE